MPQVAIIGVDLAKRVFQLHGAAADGSVLFRRKLTRGCCHTNLIPAARCLEGPLRLRPRWRLATSGTLRLARLGACGGM